MELKKNYADAVAGISNDLNSQYAVTYAVQADASTSPKHLLNVKSLNSNVYVSVQKTYFSRQVSAPSQAAAPELKQRPAIPNPTN